MAERFKIQLGDGEWFTGFEGLAIGDGRVIELGRQIDTLDGVWDLAMLGAERLDVEHRYQCLTGGPAVDLVCLEGPIVRRRDAWAQVQASFRRPEPLDETKLFEQREPQVPWMHPDNWYPAAGLPSDSVLVVRTTALADFKLKLSERHPAPDGTSTSHEGARPGGRPMSSQWPQWVAELVSLVHDEGVPPGTGAKGADQLISRISDRLAARGLEGPTRSTVQETIRVVLRRLRSAGN